MMARAFALAGLLRLRHLEEDQAAGELAAANSRMQESTAQRDRARTALGGTPTGPTSIEALYAVAAARASTRGMLADLDALGRRHASAQSEAQSHFDEARAQSLRLEKLARRHQETVTAEDLRGEQIVLDEIAATSWHREESSR
jgi:flagellar FliJ protein